MMSCWGGRGNDHLIGGEGSDTATYEYDPNGVTIVLGVSATDGYGNSDTLEEIENLIGSAGSDILTGDEQDNLIDGGSGGDALFGGRGNDTLKGDTGNDFLVGNAGDDVLDGGDGNDILVGDDALQAVSGGELPNVVHGLHLIPDVNGDGEIGGVVVGDLGTTVVPVVSIMPGQDLNPFIGVFAQLSDELPQLAQANVLNRVDGTCLVPLASIISDVGHHLGLVAGNDSLFGSGGDDTLVGDNRVVFAPDVTITEEFLDSAFGMTGDLLAAIDDLGDLIHRLDQAVGDNDCCQHFSGYDVIVDQTFRIANDELDGGSGDDFMVGDNMTIMEPSLAVPVGLVHDLDHLVDGLERVGTEATAAMQELDDVAHDLRQKVISVKQGRKTQEHLVYHIDQILAGNDSLVGGEGNDVLVGDGWNSLAPLITLTPDGQRAAEHHPWWPHDFWYHHRDWDYHRGWDDGFHYNADHKNGPEDMWNVGNDTMDGGDGDDILFGQGGDDTLRGDDGNDWLIGGDGKDTLDGGAGKNKLIDCHAGAHYFRHLGTCLHGGGKIHGRSGWTKTFVCDLASDDVNSGIKIVLPDKGSNGRCKPGKGR
jgi:Ca2+-binding RTX toxin-like protein